ncbi:elongation factor 4 [candidate division WWE3 bacterium CG10_big_fil_rev_8_21_14_0_10_35_32]|nr:MAG: elongation factor 4 [candidate division WWE3 bacterium CG10_big_fil_rev_8_21_14_0_10_35_32]
MKASNIRNYCIIAHIDHGKSTLADRMMELTGSIKKDSKTKQLLDSMDLERERGITIKLKAIRMNYVYKDEAYQLNLIDTPGHVDFGYEVSRSLAACEGAILVVDASQGVQAQTIVNLEKAKAEGLKIIPVVNKIDLPSAQVESCALELIDLGFKESDVYYTSGKTGHGVEDLINGIIENVPAPIENENDKGVPKALVFDSFFDDYRGVIVFVRVLSGNFKSTDFVKFVAARSESKIVDIGFLSPTEKKVESISYGEVGFIATGLKHIEDARVGDTATISGETPTPIPGYKVPIPVVFLSFYPDDSSEYLKLREAMERLSLNDAAFSFEPESIGSIGKGFRCGFLGLLHADIIRERVEREFGISVITTSPSVRYLVTTTQGLEMEIKSAAEFPDITTIAKTKEPWANLSVYTPVSYMSEIMNLCKERRAIFLETVQLDTKRVKISYEIPLIELIIDFYDKLKSMSSGYASIDYTLIDYRESLVSKMDILIGGDIVAPLSTLVQRQNAETEGKRIVAKLKSIIPRQQFAISIQAAVGGKILAREDVSAFRKDVTGYLYGGDVTRKMKLLEKQKRGKKRLKRFGNIDIPQDVFWKVMER